MSTAFAILPASTTVPLDAAGHGSASFTVTNQTGRSVRVRVAVVPDGDPPAPAAWLTPPPVAERDLATDGAAQFSVLVAVPARSPGGPYHFRLDAVSVALPDEEWARSPLVHFVVPEPEEPEEEEEEKKPEVVRKGYLETAAGALLGGFAGGIGAGLIGVLAMVVGLLATQGAGDLGEAIARIILLVVLAVLLAGLGTWIGAAVGVLVFLRSRGFAEPHRTALPTAVLLPLWAALLLFLVSRLPDIDLPGIVSFVLILLVVVLAIVPPALAGRALFRFRTTGGL